ALDKNDKQNTTLVSTLKFFIIIKTISTTDKSAFTNKVMNAEPTYNALLFFRLYLCCPYRKYGFS
ncbi:hypothetical protein ACLW9R_004414, partial [Shigella flexneri]